MESHEHKRQLEEIQARRMLKLQQLAKTNKLIALHLKILKENDRRN